MLLKKGASVIVTRLFPGKDYCEVFFENSKGLFYTKDLYFKSKLIFIIFFRLLFIILMTFPSSEN